MILAGVGYGPVMARQAEADVASRSHTAMSARVQAKIGRAVALHSCDMSGLWLRHSTVGQPSLKSSCWGKEQRNPQEWAGHAIGASIQARSHRGRVPEYALCQGMCCVMKYAFSSDKL
mgnify:CR=1 FL=1